MIGDAVEDPLRSFRIRSPPGDPLTDRWALFNVPIVIPMSRQDPRLIISLTTIPPRFKVVAETIASLVNQTASVESINLYLPKHYRRFGDCPTFGPVDLPRFQVRYVEVDDGPATKILPAVRDYRAQDVLLLFCDDDKIYDPDWAQRFVTAAQHRPSCCIVEEGGDVCHYSSYAYRGDLQPRAQRRPKDLSYRLRRALSFGRWKPRKTMTSGYVDALEGWGGALVRPHFFSDAVFDIPDILWMVDDLWLSGHLAINRIPIWLNADAAVRTRGNSDEVKGASLRKLVFEGHNRTLANQRCVDHFRQTYGIWR